MQEEPKDVEEAQPELLGSDEFRLRLRTEVERAGKEGVPYSVLVCVPQHFAGEDVDDIITVASGCVQALVRDEDLGGRLRDGILAIGLPNTGAIGTRVLAYRLKGDLALRTASLRYSIWQTGFACMPENGTTSERLIQAAINAANDTRARYAA